MADVVVIGSGSAGGTVAARLSEDPSCRVLLLEAGPDFPHEATDPPEFVTGGALFGEGGAGSGAPVPELDWGYSAEPLPDGRRIPLRRGKLVGGTSMINGCIAVRGRPEDFARWVGAGATGWGWEDVVPVYEAVEREGSLVTYIRRARGRANLEIRGHTLVDRVVVQHGRATGVSYLDAAGARREAQADRVVVCAGAYGSSSILLRSGIGPADELRALGVDVHADLPVGQGLLEHPGVRVVLAVDRRNARGGWPGLAVAARGDGWWGIPGVLDEERGLAWMGFFLGLVDGPDGSVRLRSTDPGEAPLIEHGYAAVAESDAFDGVWADARRLLASDARLR